MSEAITFLNPDGTPPPVGQYSNVVKVGPATATLHVAGQLPVDESANVVHPGDFAAQAELVWDLLASALTSAGSSLDLAVSIRAYLTSDDDFPAFRDSRAAAFQRHGVVAPPAATTVVVKSLYGGALIELDAVAVTG